MQTVEDLQRFLFPDEPDEWDGVVGPKTRGAVNAILNSQLPPIEGVVHEITKWPLEKDAAIFYGRSDGSDEWEDRHLTKLIPPYAMFMEGKIVRTITCHVKVAESLQRIFHRILELYPQAPARHIAGVDQYDGCYAYRPVRGSSRLSMHAYGAAIDIDAARNELGATHGTMPAEVVAIFKAEGWRWGGDYSGRKDWMHFEACR